MQKENQKSIKLAFLSVTKVVNITAAKKVAFVLVVVLTLFNGFLHFNIDPCKQLLTDGTVIDDAKWQPHGCMLHDYKNSQIKNCMKHKNIAFIGDSRLRELFYVLVNGVATNSFKNPLKAHSDVFFQEKDLDLRFHWVPEINQSAIQLYDDWNKKGYQPDVIFQGAATHTIKRLNGSSQALVDYEKNFTVLIHKMKEMKKSQIYWVLQEPVFEKRLNAARQVITNQQIDAYNRVALDFFEDTSGNRMFSNIAVLKSISEITKQTMHSLKDGLHVSAGTLSFHLQVLVNLVCNQHLQTEFGLCCQKPPTINLTQKIIFGFGCLCILISLLLNFCYKEDEQQQKDVESGKFLNKSISDIKEIFNALSLMLLILLYFYVCDRTNIFMRSNKHYTHYRFFIPLLYIFFLGVFCIDQAKSPVLLNRDQTNEWKGWMQIIILLYHVTGASRIVPIYMHIRILVAMYLFMTGYGHFAYFWQKGDVSFYRLFNVLFRVNFLTVFLCLVMDRPYQFYYYVPLCSFWFLLLYLFMLMWPQVYFQSTQNSKSNGDRSWKSQNGILLMSFKLCCFLLVIYMLFLSENFFKQLFSWWPIVKLFELSPGSLHEWWFRCQLDRFAMIHGVLFFFGYFMLKRLNILDDSKQGCLMSTKYSFFTICLALLVVACYSIWAILCSNKVDCNKVHSYIAFLPITAFILIRNIPGYFRSNYSSFFAWFGQISLELFIGQYHIWLAADTKGVLVLTSSSWPTGNIVVVTFIFVCAAHEINRITGILAKHALGVQKDGDTVAFFRFFVIMSVIITLAVLGSIFS